MRVISIGAPTASPWVSMNRASRSTSTKPLPPAFDTDPIRSCFRQEVTAILYRTTSLEGNEKRSRLSAITGYSVDDSAPTRHQSLHGEQGPRGSRGRRLQRRRRTGRLLPEARERGSALLALAVVLRRIRRLCVDRVRLGVRHEVLEAQHHRRDLFGVDDPALDGDRRGGVPRVAQRL